MSKSIHKSLQAKIQAMNGPEWDSSDDEDEKVQKDKMATNKLISSKTDKKQKGNSKKKPNNNNNNNETETERDATVVYIGHLPGELEELDLKNFLQQFGTVVNIRLSRSTKTGKSRGYAFARFEDAETASIVADTLQGYFLGKRRLVCQVVPNPHDHMFFHTDKSIARRQTKLQLAKKNRQLNLANVDKLKEITSRLVRRERKKRAKLVDLGIDYDFPGYDAVQKDNQTDNSTKTSKNNNNSSNNKKNTDDAKKESNVKVTQHSESTTPEKKTKPKQEESVDSTKKSSEKKKRKESVNSSSTEMKKKQKKHKDSIDSTNETKMGEKESLAIETPPKKAKVTSVQSEKKMSKKDKRKKRRVSAP